MPIEIKGLNSTDDKQHDFTAIKDSRFLFFGSVDTYQVRIFVGRGRKKELSKEAALQLMEELLENKKKWVSGKFKHGFNYKTVHTDFTHGNIYIKEIEQTTDNGDTKPSE